MTGRLGVAADEAAQALLRELAREAAVSLWSAPRDDAVFWGSGLLVAPEWALTCAHVMVRQDGGPRHWAGDRELGVRVGGRMVPGRVVYALPPPQEAAAGDRDDGRGEREFGPDLALVRLLEPVEHGCAWLSDRAVPPVSGQVASFAWLPGDGGADPWDGTCTVPGNDGIDVFRLGADSEIPPGASGGLVVDLAHGRVVGVVKARRRTRDGGKAVLVTALRRLTAAKPLDPGLGLGPDPYQELVRRHDRWHYRQQQPHRDARRTWIDVQRRLPGVIGEWTPADRARALGLLAELPPPSSEGVVQRLVEQVLGPGTVRDPLPVAWRDGHGLLYEPEDGNQLLAFLSYLALVAAEVRGEDRARAAELRHWVDTRALALGAAERTRLSELGAAEPSSVLVAFAPVAWGRAGPERFRWEIQLVRSADDRQITTVCDARDGVPFDEAVAQVQQPLALALDRADQADRPATVEIALPVHRFDTAAQLWTPGGGGHRRRRLPLGVRRPVVVRDVEHELPHPEWQGRWRDLARHTALEPLQLCVLDAGPGYERLRAAPGGAVPVLCGPVAQGRGVEIMEDVLEAGHGVALWRTTPHPPDACGPECDAFRRAAGALLAAPGGAAGLPEAVRALRARSHDARGRGADTPWAEHLVLLYDNADAPLHPLDGG